jgi:hypothetical protein
MKNVANIKAFAANLSAVVYVNKHHNPLVRRDGAAILYRVHSLENGDFAVEGFRASMADGEYKTYEGELAQGNLWVGAKSVVFDYVKSDDSALTPLVMPFMDSKYEEFFIAEAKPVLTFIVKAAELEAVAA